MKENHKPHIMKLPVVEYPEYNITDTEVAVSIPLFYSEVDSATMRTGTVERLKEVHAKGAIWTGLSLIRNTDLAERGVGIYFHIESSVYELLLPVFEQFGVSEKYIRQVPTIEGGKLPHPQYGKKFICLEDGVNTKRWLIMDSDAFVCSTKEKFYWYDRMKVFENPSALKSQMSDYSGDFYATWVRGICLATGVDFFSEDDLRTQEKRAFYANGYSNGVYGIQTIEKDPMRPYIATQMFLLPLQHPLTNHVRNTYKTCYQDEFLLGMWNLVHNDISDLRQKLGGLNVYDFETQFVNRDKDEDDKGYLAHIVPDGHGDKQVKVDEYYDDFFQGVSSNNFLPKPLNFSETLHTKSQHRHFYDMIFESMVYRKKRPLRVCEIGVSLFGEGSLQVFQNSDLVDQLVGLDIITYTGTLNEKSKFHKIDAYKDSTVEMLKSEYPDGFDIIIDDGTHSPEHQRFFLEFYTELLTEGGKLICEDVIDRDFFQEMCDLEECYGIDGWANASRDINEQHYDRMLIKDKPAHPPNTVQNSVSDFNHYTPPVRKTFHVLEIPYSTGKVDFACAFVQRIFKWCSAMHNLGHEVIYYGHEDSDVTCSEHVAVYGDAILKKAYGTSDYITFPEHDIDDIAFQTFRQNAEPEIRKRAKADDFALAFYGLGHLDLCEAISDLPVHIVEPSIGYPDAFSENRVYQSSPKMHFERGKADVNHFLRENYPDHPYNKLMCAEYNRMPYTVPDRNSCVIPNFFDFDHFDYSEDKDDYICFIGRINICKGLHDVFRLAEYTNTRLIAAGVGRLEKCGLDIPKQLEFVGVADIEKRNEIFMKARVHVCPSIYVEPFLGSGVESLFCGTPHITTNWGAPTDWCIHGKTGYRAQNFDHLVWALENIDKISPNDCRHQALQYSKERVSLMYHEYFDLLLQNRKGGRWSVNPERSNLDWLNAEMTESEIQIGIKRIQDAIANESG